MKKKLPQEIDPREVNNSTYVYRDAMEMLEDMRRLRRRTGWFASWAETSDRFVFHVTEPPPEILDGAEDDSVERSKIEMFAQFEVLVRDVHLYLWPSRYPQDPTIADIRKSFLTKRGASRIAQLVNETPREEVLPEAASRWNRLLNDDLV